MLGNENSESLFLSLLTEDARVLVLEKLSLEAMINFSSVSKKARNFVNEQLETEQFQTILKNQFAKEFYKFFSFDKKQLTDRGRKLEAANPWLVKAFLLAFAKKLETCERGLKALENPSTDLSRDLLAQFGRAGLPSLADFKQHLNECKQFLEEESKKSKPSVNILQAGFRDKFSYYLKWMDILKSQLIYYTIRRDGLENVKHLLTLGADVNAKAKDKNGFTALMCAAIKGHTAIVDALLATEGIDVDAKGNDGKTALIWAAITDHTEIVNALLATESIDVNATSRSGATALMWATIKFRSAIVNALLAKEGIDVNAKNTNGETALMWTARYDDIAIATALLAKEGIDVNAKDNDGETALMLAARRGHTDIVKPLLATEGIDVNATDKYGKTALMLASILGHTATVRALSEAQGATQNNNGETNLRQAIGNSHTRTQKHAQSIWKELKKSQKDNSANLITSLKDLLDTDKYKNILNDEKINFIVREATNLTSNSFFNFRFLQRSRRHQLGMILAVLDTEQAANIKKQELAVIVSSCAPWWCKILGLKTKAQKQFILEKSNHESQNSREESKVYNFRDVKRTYLQYYESQLNKADLLAKLSQDPIVRHRGWVPIWMSYKTRAEKAIKKYQESATGNLAESYCKKLK